MLLRTILYDMEGKIHYIVTPVDGWDGFQCSDIVKFNKVYQVIDISLPEGVSYLKKFYHSFRHKM